MSIARKLITVLRQKADPRMFTIMHMLLYPGVLGSLMYAAADNLASHRTQFDGMQVAVAIALFSMFVMDYAYSVTADNENHYSTGTFAADLLIVILLFVAGQRILGTEIPPHIHPAWLLVSVKAAALGWEYLKMDGARRSNEERAKKVTDFVFLLIYAFVAFVARESAQSAPYLLIIALLGDAFCYVLYRKLF